ncbi:hypothetical protein BB558_002474 [Smittium angustum]|uniref:DUF2428 domain-containing protein n=1 Tax=Smittium angustum TaxID=133377 RepID=A0A2U1J2U2_SMIAN|nr:hypothetical protein BB558_004643 [Smittium angustum]PWA01429.1 hypothetical protein BB558_002474 [Smittium angustum]
MVYIQRYNYSSCLPTYSHLEESQNKQKWLSTFKIALLASDVQSIIDSLLNLHRVELLLSSQERASLGQLLYIFASENDLIPSQLAILKNSIEILLGPTSGVKNSELTLPWVKMMEKIIDLFSHDEHTSIDYKCREKLEHLFKIVSISRRFFKRDQSLEMMKYLAPHLCTNSFPKTINFLQISSQFLPGQTEIDSNWLQTMFSLWQMDETGISRNDFIKLMAISLQEGGNKILFTIEQINYIIQNGIRSLGIEPSFTDNLNKSFEDSKEHSHINTNMFLPEKLIIVKNANPPKFLATFIVYLLDISSDSLINESVLQSIATLMLLLETSFHPSNSGPWTDKLATFLSTLSKLFLLRIRKESIIPQNEKIHSDISILTRRKFIQSVLPLCTNAMFSKNPYMSHVGINSFRLFGEAEPDIVMPILLELVYSSIDSEISSHRLYSCIQALETSIPILIDWKLYPQGTKHIIPLLSRLVVGLDISDIKKSKFIVDLVRTIALEGVYFGEVPISDEISPETEEIAGDFKISERTVANIDTESYLTQLTLSQVEYWIESFFSQIFDLIKALIPDTPENFFPTGPEAQILRSISSTCALVIFRMSEQHHFIVEKLTLDFVNSYNGFNNKFEVAETVAAIAQSMPERLLKPLITLSTNKIIEELSSEHISGSEWKLKSINSRETIKWYNAVLAKIIEYSEPTHLIDYYPVIIQSLKKVIYECPAKDISKISCKTINSLLRGLLSIKPLPLKKQPTFMNQYDDFKNKHYCYWVDKSEPSEINNLKFYIPDKNSTQLALDVIESILVPAVEKIEDIISNNTIKQDTIEPNNNIKSSSDTTVDKDHVSILIYTIQECILGLSQITLRDSANMESDFSDSDDKIFESLNTYNSTMGADFKSIDLECYSKTVELRDRVSKTLARLAEWSLEALSESPEIISLIVKFISEFICYHGTNAGKTSSGESIDLWALGWPDYTFHLPESKFPSVLMNTKVKIHSKLGLTLNAKNILPSQNDYELLQVLCKMCFSQYDKVIRRCTSSVIHIISINKAYRKLFLNMIFEYLLNGDPSEETMSSGLQLLSSKIMKNACNSEWMFIPKYFQVVKKAYDFDDVKIKKLLGGLSLTSIKIPQLKALTIPESVKNLISSICDNEESTLETSCIQKRQRQSVELYYQFLDELSNTAFSEKTKWRLTLFSTQCILQLMFEETKLSINLVNTAIKNIRSPIHSVRFMSSVLLSFILSLLKKSYLNQYDENNPKSFIETKTLADPNGIIDSSHFLFNFNQNKASDTGVYYDQIGRYSHIWPKFIKASNQITKNPVDIKKLDNWNLIKPIYESATDPSWWEHNIDYDLKQSSGNESFNHFGAMRFYLIFLLVGPEAFEALKPKLVKLSRDTTNPTSTKIFTELFSSLLICISDWPESDVNKMWEWVLPEFWHVMESIKLDDLNMVLKAILYGISKKDPHRFVPLIKSILEFDDSDAIYNNTKVSYNLAHVQAINALITCFTWRLSSVSKIITPKLLNLSSSPNKLIRDAAANCLIKFTGASETKPFAHIGNYRTTAEINQDPKSIYFDKILFNMDNIENSTTFCQNEEWNTVSNFILETVNDTVRIIEKHSLSMETSKISANNNIDVNSAKITNSNDDFIENILDPKFNSVAKFALALAKYSSNSLQKRKVLSLVIKLVPNLLRIYNQKQDQDLSYSAYYILNQLTSKISSQQTVKMVLGSFDNELNGDKTTNRTRSVAIHAISIFSVRNHFLLDSSDIDSILTEILGCLGTDHDLTKEAATNALEMILHDKRPWALLFGFGLSLLCSKMDAKSSYGLSSLLQRPKSNWFNGCENFCRFQENSC